MGREKYYDGTCYYQCRSCGLIFTEKFTVHKDCFESQVRDIGQPNVGKHKRCVNMRGNEIYYGIGDLIGIGVKDYYEEAEK